MLTEATSAAVARRLRANILNGVWKPGDRLPTRVELEDHFQVSTATVQKAVSRLATDGFVNARGRLGTFVTDSPPHLTRIGIVFHTLVQIHESRFHRALQSAAIELESNGRTRLVSYSNVDAATRTPSYRKLIADIEDHRLAGVILLTDGQDARRRFESLNLWDGRVKLVFFGRDAVPGATGLTIEPAAERVLHDLAGRGRRRLAVLHAAFAPAIGLSPIMSQWLATAQQLGIEARPEWFFPVHPYTPQAAASITRLLMSLPENQRPDALVVTDDHLVEEATRGVRDSGVVAGKDVLVYVHCNFPWPPPSLVEVRRYGFDARRLLRAAVDVIEQELDGQPPPAVVTLPMLFEEDVMASQSGEHPNTSL